MRVDRLLHHSHVLTIRGDSYRLRASAKAASSRRRPPVTALRSAPPPSGPSPAETTFNRDHNPDGGGSSS
ncbi:ATP-binding protein [Bradyrhizobium sp. 179]|uniref:ATP-binding protein n=1 Tax=Bradyrhizobium sp. 179 TaxID=2782648 RepID=UPI001FFABEFD|nr:ATP-binding protein [Bradyrhizobium sp. 179]